MCWIPHALVKSFMAAPMYGGPLSDIKILGLPKRAHTDLKHSAIAWDVVLDNSMTMGYLE